MKKTVLFLFLVATVCAFAFCQDVDGNLSVLLSLKRDNVELFDFGLSSKLVDTANAPVPVDSVFELTNVVQDYADTTSPSLVASGSVYVYWDIATREKIEISISIPGSGENMENGAMTGMENGGELEWCCYFEQDGVFHYMGSAENLVDIPQTAVERKGYGELLTIYMEGTSYPYTRTSSQRVFFQTDNAYPTDELPADEYAGKFRITVDILT